MKLRFYLLLPLMGLSISLSDTCAPPVRQGPPEPLPQDPVIEVTTVTPRFEQKARLSQGKGVYQASDRLTVTSQTKGVVEKTLVNEGDRVVSGDSLCQFRGEERTSLITRKQTEIRETQTKLDSLKQSLKTFDNTFLGPHVTGEPSFLDEEAPDKPIPPKPMGVLEADPVVDKADVLNKIKIAETDLERLNKELVELEESLKSLTVTASIGGVVIKRMVTEGSVVEVGQSLFEIVNLDPITLSFFVPQEISSYVDKGVKVTGAPLSAPELSSEGVVYYVSPALDPVKRMLELKAHFPNPQGLIKEGQEGAAEVASRKMDAVWVVPKKVIVTLEEKSWVYIVTGAQARKTEVVLGAEVDQDQVIIDANLRIDDTIISSPLQQLKDGSFVKMASGVPALNPVDKPSL